MKTGFIIRGIFLIFLGLVFLLDNLNIINFYWGSVWRFWPVIFILIGMNMIMSRLQNKKLIAPIVALITFLVLGVIGLHGLKPIENSWSNFTFENNNIDLDTSISSPNYFIEPYEGSMYADLNIQTAASSLIIGDSTSNLFEADVRRQFGNYTLTKGQKDSVETLTFKMKNQNQKINLNKIGQNKTKIKMNLTPIWDVKLEMGAGEAKFDLSNFKLRSLKFSGGAAAFDAKIGSEMPLTTVNVEAGVADIMIKVPVNSGCRIYVESGLSSKFFKSFIKKADGYYETSNYAEAENKININFEGGVSSFKVVRY